MELPARSRVVRTAVTFSASAIAMAPVIPDGVSPEVEGGQDRRDLQRHRDRYGTLVPDPIENA